MYFLVSTTIWNLGASLCSTYLQLAACRPFSSEVIFNQRTSCSLVRLFPMDSVFITIFTALNLAFETAFQTTLQLQPVQSFLSCTDLSKSCNPFVSTGLVLSECNFNYVSIFSCHVTNLSYLSVILFAFYQYKCKYG